MPPPPRNGGIASSSSRRPHSTPIPVGPSILWALKARKSQPSRPTSVGRWGTDWAPSASTSAPARWAASAMRAKGVIVPSTFDMVVQATSFTPSRRRSRSERSRRYSSSMPIQRSSMPRSSASISHGTMLAWCSMSVSSTTSPRPRFARPHVAATRLIASVAFLVKITSCSGSGGADEPADRDAGRVVEAVRLLGDGVDAAVHVGVGGLVVRVHGVEDALRPLGRRGRVEVDDPVPVHGAAEHREVAFELGEIHMSGARRDVRRGRGPDRVRAGVGHGHLRHGS